MDFRFDAVSSFPRVVRNHHISTYHSDNSGSKVLPEVSTGLTARFKVFAISPSHFDWVTSMQTPTLTGDSICLGDGLRRVTQLRRKMHRSQTLGAGYRLWVLLFNFLWFLQEV